MEGMARQRGHADPVGFTNDWDYLSDQLRCLDLRLHQQILKQARARNADPLAPFKGLVISEAEIADLLGEGATGEASAAAERQKLEQELTEFRHQIQARLAASREAGANLSLCRLSKLFHLSEFEEQCVVICLGPEIDRKYEKLYGYLQDDATRRKPGVDLVLNLLCGSQADKLAARAAFDPEAALIKFGLLQMTDAGGDGPSPLLSRALKLDERIAGFLLGHGRIDARLERFCRPGLPRETDSGVIAEQELYRRTTSFVQACLAEPRSTARNAAVYLHGPANLDQRLVVEAVCRKFTLPLLVADVEALKSGPLPFGEAAWLLAREAALQSAVLCLEHSDCLVAEPEKHLFELNALIAAANAFSRLTFMFGTKAWHAQALDHACLFLSVAVARPDLAACKSFWDQSLAAC